MTTQPSIAQARQTQEIQVEQLRKLQRDKQTATGEQQLSIQQEVDRIDEEIRDLDTVIQSLLSQRR